MSSFLFKKITLTTLITALSISSAYALTATKKIEQLNLAHQAKHSNTIKKSLLFTQLAGNAVLTPIQNKPGWYSLKLSDVSHSTLWFTDRPYRQTGAVTTQSFVNHWNGKSKNNFNQTPPNANLVIFYNGPNSLKSMHEHVLMLNSPKYNKLKDILIYKVKLLSNSKHLPLESNPHKVKEAALFIDSFTLNFGLGIGKIRF